MSEKNSHVTGRVVVVGAGFGVWHDGRHLASARWSDVRAIRMDDEGRTTMLLLRDDTGIPVADDLMGYDMFLLAAEEALPGMRGAA